MRYQQILHEVRPALIVETRTAHGGSAYYLVDLCDIFGTGHIVSIDIDGARPRPAHPRISYLTGSSTEATIVDEVKNLTAEAGGSDLVILDSDHSQRHVAEELRRYAPLVSVGSYLIVEDTNVNGHPALPAFGLGPMEAVDAFLSAHDDFVIDESQHRFLMTFNPRGYLQRVG